MSGDSVASSNLVEMNYTLLVILFLILTVVDYAATDSEVKVPLNTGVDLKGALNSDNTTKLNEKPVELSSGTDSNGVDRGKKGKDQVVSGSKEDVKNKNLESGGSSKELESQGVHKEQQVKDGSVSGSEKKEKSSEESVSKEVPKEGTSLSARKEGPLGEECDSSNSCTDEKKALVACLRVPGNESPDLSLLIQNKGTGPLNVVISAPEFVRIEGTKFQLPEKQNKKVMVSIRNAGTDNSIVLTAGNGNCSLDFRDFTTQHSREGIDSTSQSTHIVLIKRIPSFALIFFAAFVVALALIYFSVRKGQSYKYQKLDMDLPVSSGPKIDSDENDAWDNSWGDNWDDEEAPKTPSLPVTPSLSSKGLAARRLNKDGWKD